MPNGRRALNLLYVAPALVVGLLFVLMLTPLPDLGYLFGTLVDFMHIPLFAFLALVVWILTGPFLVRKPIRKALLVWGIVTSIGITFEGLQVLTGRTASLHDIGTNLLGSGMLLSFLLSTLMLKPGQQKLWRIASIVCLLLALYRPALEVYDVIRMRLDFPRIADFESRHELCRWRGENADICRSDSWAVDSTYSMHVEFSPAKFSGVWIPYSVPDWSAYSNLIVYINIPEGSDPVPLQLKLEDAHHNGKHNDRFNYPLNLESGSHTIRLPLSQIKLEERDFDLTQVRLLQFMVWEQTEAHEIYLDAIRLE
ncbi:MAG: hypothetical protein R3C11_26025 [Planctomycetaceae bacterium]